MGRENHAAEGGKSGYTESFGLETRERSVKGRNLGGKKESRHGSEHGLGRGNEQRSLAVGARFHAWRGSKTSELNSEERKGVEKK